MSRKERIARRLEGIESDPQPVGFVADRLLEEDMPRYTRASDPCGVTVGRFNKEGTESQEMLGPPAERQSRSRCRAEEHAAPMESSYDPAGLESKAERIARYKAERRRQLAERYGISLDQEPDVDYTSRYARPRKERDVLETQVAMVTGETKKSCNQAHLSSGSTEPGLGTALMEVNAVSERERLMNLENYRRGQAEELDDQPPYMDMSASAQVPSRDGLGILRTSASSPKHVTSHRDLVIEQQVPSVLNSQGIGTKPKSDWFLQTDSEGDTQSLINWPSRVRVRERMAKEEGVSGSPEPIPDPAHSPSRRLLLTAQYPGPRREVFDPQVMCGSEAVDCQSYLSVLGMSKTRSPGKEEVERGFGGPDGICTEGLLKSRKAVLPSEIRRRERSLEDPRRGCREDEPQGRRRGPRRDRGSPEDCMLWDRASGARHGRSWENQQQCNTGSNLQREPEAFDQKPKALTRSISDSPAPASTPRATLYRNVEMGTEGGLVFLGTVANGEHVTLDAGVSVAKLRLSYLESTGANKRPELEAKVDLVQQGEGLAGSMERGRGTRKPKRYISPGDSRKASERFRTQPVTSAEHLESDRSGLSPDPPNTEVDEEKLDDRAKLSVAAKRSLFRELEKRAEGRAPKPRPRNVEVERRMRRTQDRSHTQPVTTEEVVIAATYVSLRFEQQSGRLVRSSG